MSKFRTLIIAFLCLIGFCAIAVAFNVFNIDQLPASFVGAALGAVITGVVTVILLEGQTKTEEIKERNVKVFEEKSKIFRDYIALVWKVWEDHKITAEEFQKLTADYYSKLMIYLKDDSIEKILKYLSEIGEYIDKESGYKQLRHNVIGIINVLSEEISLGGHIDEKGIEELDKKTLPVFFKKTLVDEIKNKIKDEAKILSEGYLKKRCYKEKLEYLFFEFVKYPNCKVVIGPFDDNRPIKLMFDVDVQLTQFDNYRRDKTGRFRYWIKTNRNDNNADLILNDVLPKEGDGIAIEDEYPDIKQIEKFGFNDVNSLDPFIDHYLSIVSLLAERVAYYLSAKTINKQYSILELPDMVLKENR